jgi:hypothetical protein
MELKISTKVNSDDLKTLALSWLRFEKQFNLICTEDPFRQADAIGTDTSQQCRKMIEIETKISISDLRADLNKRLKHERMGKLFRKETILDLWQEDPEHTLFPSQFYFLVPGALKDKAIEVVKELYPHAGLMEARLSESSDGRYRPGTLIVMKRAPVLHRLLIGKQIKNYFANRQSSEICRLRLDVLRQKWDKKE